MDEFEFEDVSSGDWVKGSDHVGHWVLIRLIKASTRDGDYGEQTVIEMDFCDLNTDNELTYGVQNSDAYIAGKIAGKKPGALVVGKVEQGEPKKKSWKGAIYLVTPGDEAQAKAQAKAKKILAAEAKANAEKSVKQNDESDELDELLLEDD